MGTITLFDPKNAVISGGTIDDTVIGGTVPAAGTFTTLSGTTSVVAASDITITSGSIVSGSGAISFGDENLTIGGNLTLTEGKVSITDTTDEVALVIDSSATGSNGMTLAAPTSGYIARFINEHATTPVGLHLDFSASSPNDATQVFLCCEDSTTARIELRSNGGIANFQSNDADLSDQRVKTELNKCGSYWDMVSELRIGTYRYLDQTNSRNNLGLIAQDLNGVAPEFVDKSNPDLWRVYNKDLYFAVITVVQEVQVRVEAVEGKIQLLESEIEELKAT